MRNKILLAAPNSIHKNYCFYEWYALIKNFKCDIFIADNSPGNKNRKLYQKLGIDFKWINPKGKTSPQFIYESQNAIRDKVLSEGYTHLFFLETDLFPPKNILPVLECLNLPVVSVPYFIYKGKDTMQMNQEFRIFHDLGITRNMPLAESFKFIDGSVHQCFATGFGCSLIKSEVLKRVPFRYQEDYYVRNEKGSASHADSFFYADLQKAKIPAYLYTGTTIRHYNSNWIKLKLN